MAQDAHLESLLSRIQAMRDGFGRAAADLDAICSRARADDFRGVLQNARVVTETLLRSIIHREKGQAPGKDTLEKLIPKLFQEGKPSILPTHIVVHVRTIQAWGNVGAHDQAGDLFAEGLEVKGEEAMAAVNSLVAILEWYQEKYLADGSTPSRPLPKAQSQASSPAKVASAPSAPAAPAEKSKAPMLAGMAVVAVVGLGVAFFLSGKGGGADDGAPVQQDDPKALASARAALNRAYVAAHEFPPPKTCEAKSRDTIDLLIEVTRLLEGGQPKKNRTQDQKALAALQAAKGSEDSAEYWMQTARALHFTGATDDTVRDTATKSIELCKEYAAPHNLHGNIGLLSGDAAFARLSYQRAIELAPDYLSPSFNLGLIELKDKNVDQAIIAFTKVLKKDPEYAVAYQTRARAYLTQGNFEAAADDLKAFTQRKPENAGAFALLGQVHDKLNDESAARKAYCRAKALGHQAAAEKCP